MQKVKKLTQKNGTVDFALPSRRSPQGNIFFIFGAWQKEARESGWSNDDTEEVLREAKSGDYDYARKVIAETCSG